MTGEDELADKGKQAASEQLLGDRVVDKASTAGPRDSAGQMAQDVNGDQATSGTGGLPDVLADQLKEAYGSLVNAPLPDKILDLVRKLKSESGAGAGKRPAETRRDEDPQK